MMRRKLFSLAVGLLVFTPFIASAQTAEEQLQAQITVLIQQIQTLQAQVRGQQIGNQSSSPFIIPLCLNDQTNYCTNPAVDVQNLQNFLIAQGYSSPQRISSPDCPTRSALPVTGIFGCLTRNAVKAFQRDHTDTTGRQLPVTGYFGILTQGAVNQIQAGGGGSSLKPGDCNGDGTVNAVDQQALSLEILDEDGINPQNAPSGSYPGTSQCDANQDSKIDSGDIACLPLLLAGGSCAAPSIMVTSPNGREIWQTGNTYPVTYTVPVGVTQIGYKLLGNKGAVVYTSPTPLPATGQYNFFVDPSYATALAGNTFSIYTIRVYDWNNPTNYDDSDASFTVITPAPTAPFDFTLSPLNPQTITQGQTALVQITAQVTSGANQQLTFSPIGGFPSTSPSLSPQTCMPSFAGLCTVTFSMTTTSQTNPQPYSTQFLVYTTNSSVQKTVNFQLTILPSLTVTPQAAPFTVSSPNTPTTWIRGVVYPVTWQGTGDMVDIALYPWSAKGTSPLPKSTVRITPWGPVANTGSYSWTIPKFLVPDGQYFIRVACTQNCGPNAQDDSDAPLTIQGNIPKTNFDYTITSITYQSAGGGQSFTQPPANQDFEIVVTAKSLNGAVPSATPLTVFVTVTGQNGVDVYKTGFPGFDKTTMVQGTPIVFKTYALPSTVPASIQQLARMNFPVGTYSVKAEVLAPDNIDPNPSNDSLPASLTVSTSPVGQTPLPSSTRAATALEALQQQIEAITNFLNLLVQ